MIAVDTGISHVTPGDKNLFEDLGFSPEEAKAFLEESDRILKEKIAIKDNLMAEISVWMREKQLKQADAAVILGVTRPRVSDVIHKKYVKFTIDALVEMLTRTGKRVLFSVN